MYKIVGRDFFILEVTENRTAILVAVDVPGEICRNLSSFVILQGTAFAEVISIWEILNDLIDSDEGSWR